MGKMTTEDIKKEIRTIRDFLGNSPELSERGDITVDQIEVFLNMCDELNSAVDQAYTMLDDLLIKFDVTGEQHAKD